MNLEGGSTIAQGASPLKPLNEYISTRDYPTQAIIDGSSGASRVTMMIDETGTVKDCLVEETSGIASLDAMTCIAFQSRAKFRPALDAAGKPVRSIATQKVVWKVRE